MSLRRKYADFGAKLHLTAAALGCVSRKAFCARFHAVNPRTQCEIERLHKWMQGRAIPRDAAFFEDWRAVIGTTRPASWLQSCSVEVLAVELATLFAIPLEELRVPRPPKPPQANVPLAVFGARSAVYGTFACYSHAFSPLFKGKLIRGALRISEGEGRQTRAVYTETLINGTYRMSGEAILSGGMLHVMLKDGTTDLPLFLCLIAPGPPGSVLSGILAGPTLTSNTPSPTATRFVAVRVPDDAPVEDGNGYLGPDPVEISENLKEAGLNTPERERAGTLIMAALGPGTMHAAFLDQLQLCDLLDAAQLAQV